MSGGGDQVIRCCWAERQGFPAASGSSDLGIVTELREKRENLKKQTKRICSKGQPCDHSCITQSKKRDGKQLADVPIKQSTSYFQHQ